MGRKHHAGALAGSSLAFHALIVRRLLLVIAQRRRRRRRQRRWAGWRRILHHRKRHRRSAALEGKGGGGGRIVKAPAVKVNPTAAVLCGYGIITEPSLPFPPPPPPPPPPPSPPPPPPRCLRVAAQRWAASRHRQPLSRKEQKPSAQ